MDYLHSSSDEASVVVASIWIRSKHELHRYRIPEFPVMRPTLVRIKYSIEYKVILQDTDENKDEFAILDGYVNTETEIGQIPVPIKVSSPAWCFIPVS